MRLSLLPPRLLLLPPPALPRRLPLAPPLPRPNCTVAAPLPASPTTACGRDGSCPSGPLVEVVVAAANPPDSSAAALLWRSHVPLLALGAWPIAHLRSPRGEDDTTAAASVDARVDSQKRRDSRSPLRGVTAEVEAEVGVVGSGLRPAGVMLRRSHSLRLVLRYAVEEAAAVVAAVATVVVLTLGGAAAALLSLGRGGQCNAALSFPLRLAAPTRL